MRVSFESIDKPMAFTNNLVKMLNKDLTLNNARFHSWLLILFINVCRVLHPVATKYVTDKTLLKRVSQFHQWNPADVIPKLKKKPVYVSKNHI